MRRPLATAAHVEKGRGHASPLRRQRNVREGGFETRPYMQPTHTHLRRGEACVALGPQRRMSETGRGNASPLRNKNRCRGGFETRPYKGDACVAPTKNDQRLQRRLRAVEELGRIDRRRSLADLEVQLGSI